MTAEQGTLEEVTSGNQHQIGVEPEQFNHGVNVSVVEVESRPGTSGFRKDEAVSNKYVDDRINTMQQYFDKRFDSLAKVMELERQLEENRKQLSTLREKGRWMNQDRSVDQDLQSELTVYKNAVEKKRGSSSSEDDIIDTSDEIIMNMSNNFVEKELSEQQRRRSGNIQEVNAGSDFRQRKDGSGPAEGIASRQGAAECADDMIREAEESRARIYDAKGKQLIMNNQVPYDNDYLLVASHVDESLRQKIADHEYIDFAKLLRKDKATDEDQHQKMIMVNKGGMSYWVPMTERGSTINGYAKWTLTFRVFLDIYTGFYPERTSELIQYSHII